MTRWLAGAAMLAAATVTLSGCYTVLRGPSLSSSPSDDQEPPQHSRWEDAASAGDRDRETPRIGRFDDGDGLGPYGQSPYRGGYPVMGYDSQYGLYGFGTPFAYGPAGYPGYSSAYGPYGYGYDPYYSGNGGTYIPPGYELVTSQELTQLRADVAALQSGTQTQDAVPAIDQAALLRQQQQEAQRVWEQRNDPERKSTAGYRTPSPAPVPATSTVAPAAPAGSTKPAADASGGDAAKRRKTRR